jgi:oligopeptide/dipeptide ABC transporter ATP-binding protein
MNRLLEVDRLTVELATARGWVRPVDDVSLQMAAGETLGLVGESGSGKTMLSLALMGLLPVGAKVSGEVHLAPRVESFREVAASGTSAAHASRMAGRNLLHLRENEWRAVRGAEIAMVFQEPMTSLNPVMPVGAQVAEAIRAHHSNLKETEVHKRTIEALRRASVPEPQTRTQQFPHQLSGGLRQRVMIAMALAAAPRLLIADEPTTALDVTVQKQVLTLLDHLRREMRLGMLFITHDLGVVAQVADRVAVMYAGRIIEQGPVREVLTQPQHPYTKGLLAASPTLQRGKLAPIPGAVPQLTELPRGCAFEPRCAWRRAECVTAVPALRAIAADHRKGLPPQSAGSLGHAARCVLVPEGTPAKQEISRCR